MIERPVLFSAPMVRAILSGQKTQTRRAASKPFKHPDLGNLYTAGALVLEREPQHVIDRACRHGQPGDRLWVRETFGHPWHHAQPAYLYRASDDGRIDTHPDFDGWTPSIHMPRAASRITLEITGVRVERLQDISEADARAEGVDYDPGEGGMFHVSGMAGCCSDTATGSYRKLWTEINGPESWAANPWVWVLEFKRLP